MPDASYAALRTGSLSTRKASLAAAKAAPEEEEEAEEEAGEEVEAVSSLAAAVFSSAAAAAVEGVRSLSGWSLRAAALNAALTSAGVALLERPRIV